MGGWHDAHAFAPGHSSGQWISALLRYYAVTGDETTRLEVAGLVRGYGAVITGAFFSNNRFPAYTLEKLNCGLIDARQFAGDGKALAVMRKTTAAALPHLPEKALSRVEQQARPHKGITYAYDESYTLPENYLPARQRERRSQISRARDQVPDERRVLYTIIGWGKRTSGTARLQPP